MNLVIEIEYDGTNYSGWQFQPRRRTIQGEIEKALSQLYQMRIKIVGASRTDAGVSAQGQIANFYVPTLRFKDLAGLIKSLNAILPDDICVKQALVTDNDFHARYSAKGKIYQYHILCRYSPLRQRFAWVVRYKLNLSSMRKAVKLFLRQKDYSAFCKVKDKNGKIIMKSISIKKNGDEVFISIEADRFLYKMVRRIIGALIDVGRGHRNEDDIKNSLIGCERRTLVCALAKGLVLVKVKY
jgi:tRNA pseudouridine38-40 synthase